MKIEVIDYTKKIGDSIILNQMNLEMESGKVYGLKGKNGSGKTMLMRAICGLINATSGCVKIDGEIIGKQISFPRNVGILLENPGFISEYSGYKNLKLLADIKGKIGEEEIRSAMEKVGLDPNETKKFKKYSLGMKQKLGIAAAIMENPDIVLLDEPTNALDEASIELFNQVLVELKQQGKIVIWSSHDSEELRKYSDELFVINLGNLQEHILLEKTDDEEK